MNVSAAGTGVASLRTSMAAASAGKVLSDPSGRVGPLLASDVAALRAATGVDFNWPPADGERFPEAAIDLSAARARQAAANIPMKDLTAQDLSALRARDLLDDGMLAKGLDYLKKGTQATGVDPVTSPATRPTAQTAPGTVTSDGSIYF